MSSFGRPLLTFADKVQQLTAIVVQSLIKFALSLQLKSQSNCATGRLPLLLKQQTCNDETGEIAFEALWV